MPRPARYALLTAIAVSCGIAPAIAAPVIRNVSLRGLQIGAATTIVIDGNDLLPAPRLVTALPLASQEVLPNATATRVEIKATLAADVVPGLYNLRIASGTGISSTIVVAVDKLPQLALNEKEKAPALPVALHGSIGGPQILRTSFDGRAGQTITIDVEANRLGSKLRPVVQLYDARGVQLAWAWPLTTLAGDARLETRLPADGVYTIAIHDLLYQGQAPGHFRLKIGEFQYADGVFPPVVERGKPASLELLGNVADRRVELKDAATESLLAAPWPDFPLATGPRPRIAVSDSTELVESDVKDPLQQLSTAPVAVSGRLAVAGEEDRYLVAVMAGAKILFDVQSARLGSPTDLSLELTDEKGARLAFADDGPETTDPRLEYTAPAGVERVILAVRDTLGRGGKSCIYRVTAQLADPQPARADFELVLAADGHNVPQAGHEVLQVLALRKGYDGPIALAFDQLPPGITVEGNEIPAGASGTLVVLKGVDPAAAPTIAKLRGTANVGGVALVRTASFEQFSLGALQPWLQNEVALAIAPTPAELFVVEFASPAADPKFSIGSKLKLPVKVTRSVADGGPVRLSLVTSQNVPRVGGNPDLNQAIRPEGNLEIPIDGASLAAADALVAAAKVLTDTQVAAQKADEAAAKAVAEVAVKVKAAEDKKLVEDTAAKTAGAAATSAGEAKAAADKLLADAQEKAKAAAAGTDQAAKDATAQEVQKAAAQVTATTAAFVAADGKAKAAAAALAVAEKALADQQAAAKIIADTAAKTKADGEAKVKDADAKRLAAATAAQAAAAAAKYASELSVVVPGPLPVGAYSLAIRAEMLSRDRGRVIATTVTAPQRLVAVTPIAIVLTGSPQLSAKLDAKTGAKLVLAGKLERLADFKGDATITLAGLPPGIAVPTKVLKPEMSDFELELALPPNLAAGEFKGIKLFATGPPDPAQAGIIVRSLETPLSLSILAADPPAK